MKKKISLYFVLCLSLIYFISQFNRASLGAIPEVIIKEFLINNEQLGRLGGIFFLSFALVQIPIGIFLDRFNPLKVIFFMLFFIFIGSICISLATSYEFLLLARSLQGIGCGVCLMGPLVILAKYGEKKKFSEYSGYVMGIGGLGALAATKPFYILTLQIGWREGFLITTSLIVFLIIFIFILLCKRKYKFPNKINKQKFNFKSYISIFSNKNFLLMLPMSIFGYASFAFLLTLWGNRYLSEVQNLMVESISDILMLMALFWTLGSIFFGYLEKIFSKKNIVIVSTFLISALLSILALVENLSPIKNYIIFSLFGFVGAYTLIVISHYKALFETKIVGKVLTTANLFNFGGVFFVQWLTGFIIHLSVVEFNTTKALAYKLGFLTVVFFLFISTFLYFKTDDV